jgi:hypothetical protein
MAVANDQIALKKPTGRGSAETEGSRAFQFGLWIAALIFTAIGCSSQETPEDIVLAHLQSLRESSSYADIREVDDWLLHQPVTASPEALELLRQPELTDLQRKRLGFAVRKLQAGRFQARLPDLIEEDNLLLERALAPHIDLLEHRPDLQKLMIGHPDPDTRISAQLSIAGQVSGKRLLLLQFRREPLPEFRRLVLRYVGDSSEDILLLGLADELAEVRRVAVVAAEGLGSKELRRRIELLAEHDVDESVREASHAWLEGKELSKFY